MIMLYLETPAITLGNSVHSTIAQMPVNVIEENIAEVVKAGLGAIFTQRSQELAAANGHTPLPPGSLQLPGGMGR
jgi:hypothetical protein